ncbi:uncharacterized protein BO96DRAFT_331430 [Aspergillus niger CBS 101883]|uniref:Contig An04c0140, genomic contig n=2 Tax=Aspergillus niger TaxID=5061 RepID=A2QIM0_ASPNC|nr:uncharacterized protein BO96DRAFT_331430 [Aspergillus niger CBS 101883]XP_059600514.1 uncharacterized protein An04g04000 [Aspergillus niger]PYH59470.1 hypothetical protein BO96DRAFT_331430 [Aspergillus niger CBS 101883]CAK38664.1 unnamed protein product [Aspergillus niger]
MSPPAGPGLLSVADMLIAADKPDRLRDDAGPNGNGTIIQQRSEAEQGKGSIVTGREEDGQSQKVGYYFGSNNTYGLGLGGVGLKWPFGPPRVGIERRQSHLEPGILWHFSHTLMPSRPPIGTWSSPHLPGHYGKTAANVPTRAHVPHALTPFLGSAADVVGPGFWLVRPPRRAPPPVGLRSQVSHSVGTEMCTGANLLFFAAPD